MCVSHVSCGVLLLVSHNVFNFNGSGCVVEGFLHTTNLQCFKQRFETVIDVQTHILGTLERLCLVKCVRCPKSCETCAHGSEPFSDQCVNFKLVWVCIQESLCGGYSILKSLRFAEYVYQCRQSKLWRCRS